MKILFRTSTHFRHKLQVWAKTSARTTSHTSAHPHEQTVLAKFIFNGLYPGRCSFGPMPMVQLCGNRTGGQCRWAGCPSSHELLTTRPPNIVLPKKKVNSGWRNTYMLRVCTQIVFAPQLEATLIIVPALLAGQIS